MDELQQKIDLSKSTPIQCEKCGHVNKEFQSMDITQQQ